MPVFRFGKRGQSKRTSRPRLMNLSLRKRLIVWKISPLWIGRPSPIQLWKADPMDSPLGTLSILWLKLFLVATIPWSINLSSLFDIEFSFASDTFEQKLWHEWILCLYKDITTVGWIALMILCCRKMVMKFIVGMSNKTYFTHQDCLKDELFWNYVFSATSSTETIRGNLPRVDKNKRSGVILACKTSK